MKTFFTNKYFLIFLLMEAVIFSGAWYFYLVYEQKYADEVIGKIDTAFHTTINGYAMVSQILFDEVINKPDIINIFKQAHTATTEQQIPIRQQLFDTLNPVYQRLKQKNLRQLHFHLPDNTSFLRFHKPQKFGDNLSKIRYSVMTTNKYKLPSQGFEEGRIFNGFRYVFPLFDGEQHIGSVETSVSFNAIRQEIQKIYGLEYNIMLRREIVEQKLFASQLGHYNTCALDEHFLCENRQAQNSTLLKQIEQKMQESVHLKLETGKPFVKHVQIQNNFYDVAFYPINNIENQKVAYIITYNPSNRLYELQMQFIILFISITFTNALIFIFFYHKTKSGQLIAEKNKYLTLLNQEKNEFLGIAAHDLKNPLQAIQGSAELIDMTLSEQAQICKHQCRQDVSEFTQMITESVERMFDLITNLLDVNAIESGKLKIHLRSENILPVLEKVVNEYSKKAQSKHIHIHFAAQQKNCNACVDIAALHQVLDNLVSNAVKYSPHGKKIYIHVSEYEQQVRIEVQDEGVGISQEEQKKLFGKFVRLSPKPTGDEHSTGLGLFIAKKLVEAMQGQIRCESQVGQGTKFIAEFPSASHATC